MNDAVRAELRALATRAADLEARKQSAERRGDTETVEHCLAELRRLWSRHADLERIVA